MLFTLKHDDVVFDYLYFIRDFQHPENSFIYVGVYLFLKIKLNYKIKLFVFIKHNFPNKY